MFTFDRAFTFAALAIGLISTGPAVSGTIEKFAVAGWDGGAFSNDETSRFANCTIVRNYPNGSSLIFYMHPDYKLEIALVNSGFAFTRGDIVTAKLQIDRNTSFTGKGIASQSDSVLFLIGTGSKALNIFRRGNVMTTSIRGRSYRYRLDGTSRALTRLRQCVDQNRNYQKSVAAEPQEDRKLMVLDAAVLSNNIAVRAGIAGFQLITTEEHRKMLGSPDAMWRTGALVGFLNIHEKAGGITLDAGAPFGVKSISNTASFSITS